MLNRNPVKRLGSGPRDAEEIKEHPFFAEAKYDWDAVRSRKLPVPPPNIKRLLVQDIPEDKVYGKGAFDQNLKNLNRVPEWSYIRK